MNLLLDKAVPRRLAPSFSESFTMRTVQEMAGILLEDHALDRQGLQVLEQRTDEAVY